MCDLHDIGISFLLQLDHISAVKCRPYFFGWPALGPPELNCNQPITVNSGAHIGRTGVKTGADHPAQFSMRVDAFAHEFGPRGNNEIAAHASPCEVKIVVVMPDIGPGTGHGIDPFIRIVLTGSGKMD